MIWLLKIIEISMIINKRTNDKDNGCSTPSMENIQKEQYNKDYTVKKYSEKVKNEKNRGWDEN